MRSEQIKMMADEALHRLAEQLEKGRSDQLKTFLAAMGRFHRYSVSNVMLIMARRPDATHVAGFQTWKQLGRRVRRGQKGIAILAPIVRGGTTPDDLTSREEDEAMHGFRRAHVFDINQTEGRPLPQAARVRGDPAGHLERLIALVAARGIKLEYGNLRGALGASTGGTIYMQKGLEPAEAFATLVHELAHAVLHRIELPSKTVRETEAEAIAFVVCEAIGLDTNTTSSDYIHLYHGDKHTLANSLTRIRQIASDIITDLVPCREH